MNDNSRSKVIDFKTYAEKRAAWKRAFRKKGKSSTAHMMLYVMVQIVAERKNMRFNFLHALIATRFGVESIDALSYDDISDAIMFLTLIMLDKSATMR